mmetsp:Transcript_19429/g.37422  ORF Transcript_19429/g.37422 Transcript_19429/m.37422 type:complete len:527 (-) Transcript_19429:133-1713(-)
MPRPFATLPSAHDQTVIDSTDIGVVDTAASGVGEEVECRGVPCKGWCCNAPQEDSSSERQFTLEPVVKQVLGSSDRAHGYARLSEDQDLAVCMFNPPSRRRLPWRGIELLAARAGASPMGKGCLAFLIFAVASGSAFLVLRPESGQRTRHFKFASPRREQVVVNGLPWPLPDPLPEPEPPLVTNSGSAVAVASNTSHGRACNATCTTQGRTGTCSSRILAAAIHRHSEMGACVAAYYWVQARCSSCTACMFSDADCKMPRPTQATRQPHNCSADLSTWKSSWSVIKKYWCCHYEKRGCAPQPALAWRRPLFDCREGSAWSTGEHAWCCRHKRLGCPSRRTSSITATTTTTTPVIFARVKVASIADPPDTTATMTATATSSSNTRDAPAGTTTIISATLRNITTSAAAANPLAATHSAALPNTTTTTLASTTTSTLGIVESVRLSSLAIPRVVKRAEDSVAATSTLTPSAAKRVSAPAQLWQQRDPLLLFDCETGRRNGWSADKRRWCCEHRKGGCSLQVKAIPSPH